MIYAMNTATLGLSSYVGITLPGITAHALDLYGSAADGLIQFTGDDDDGAAIAWKLETGLAEHGSQRDKGFARAYVGVDNCSE